MDEGHERAGTEPDDEDRGLGRAGHHHDHAHPHLHEAFDLVRDAAIEAELDTGRREDTVEQARASVLRRVGRMVAGFSVAIVGIILMPLPGPGLVVFAGGLAILARDFAWAERTLANVQRRIPRDAHGKIPPVTWALMSVTAVVGVSVSLWWNLLR